MAGNVVLVVEDDFDIREVVGEVLESEGFEVLTASNGREALEVLDREAAPNAIVLDMMMPVMSGPEVLEALNRDPVRSEIPVVVVSAQDQRVAGVEAFVPKPFSPDDLVRTLRSVVARRGPARATATGVRT